MVNLASEFPNDNPALHRGVIWVCVDLTGRAQPERACSSEPLHTPSELATDPAATEVSAPAAIEEAPSVAAFVEESTLDVASAPETIAEPSLVAPPAGASASPATEMIASIVSHYDSLALPEDDEEDDAAEPIVVEELEPVEASLEGMSADDAVVAMSAEAVFVV